GGEDWTTRTATAGQDGLVSGESNAPMRGGVPCRQLERERGECDGSRGARVCEVGNQDGEALEQRRVGDPADRLQLVEGRGGAGEPGGVRQRGRRRIGGAGGAGGAGGPGEGEGALAGQGRQGCHVRQLLTTRAVQGP